jgi:predicted membrane protein
MSTRPFRMSFQLFLGLFIIILGVLYTLENLGIVYAHDYLRFWPVLLILYGATRVIQCETTRQKGWGIFWIIVGSFMVLDRLDLVYFSVWDLWPLVLVLLGISLIWKPSGRTMRWSGVVSVGESSNTINALALMGGFKRANDSQDFQGGEATAIMGGCEIDLRKASIQQGEAVMNLFSVMGGIEIWVPEDWKVVLQGVPILGGFEDKTHPTSAESNKRLVVRGYAVMGSVEIKN